jgi:hypothetical protein
MSLVSCLRLIRYAYQFSVSIYSSTVLMDKKSFPKIYYFTFHLNSGDRPTRSEISQSS